MKMVEPGSSKNWSVTQAGTQKVGPEKYSVSTVTLLLLAQLKPIGHRGFPLKEEEEKELDSILYEPKIDGLCGTVSHRVVLKDSRDGKYSQ